LQALMGRGHKEGAAVDGAQDVAADKAVPLKSQR